ncbi:Metal-dependent hydrolase of the beta-lactamase superfamily III [Minicystis rosea]|nr:Metal-dependent hydrolase of the beta-lactamase superfamily III [Minicystis rosea]
MSRASLHNPGRPVSLRFGALEIEAFSISGLATYVHVPAFDACFDLGHCSVEASRTRNVILSHVHQDHSLGVVRHLSLRAMTGARPPHVYLPAESRDALVDMLRAYARLEQREPGDLESIVRGVAAGDTFSLSPRYVVRAFDVVHRIPSRGFTVVENRRKLKPAFLGMAGEQIRAARERGEELYDYTAVDAFTYIGDSTIETLERNPEIGRSEVLFLEATHLPGTSPEVSARYGHTHLDEIAALFEKRPEILASPHIVLKHFSMKYDAPQIRASLSALPPALRARVTLLVR